MAVPFDHITPSVDTALTRSVIGQLQRKRVWSYLEKITPQLNGLEILELNCGGGEDAILFSDKGFNILATDVSEEMLKVTTQKANQYSMQNKVSSQYLELDSFDETVFDKKFDLIFSNFGGLNCIDRPSLQKLLRRIPSILAAGGRFVGVIMPKFCLWETAYLLLRFRFRGAFRRLTSNEIILDPATQQKMWLYSPSEIEKWSGEKFKFIRTVPIGFPMPPLHLEQYFVNKNKFLLRLYQWGKKTERFSFLSGMADCYVIDLQLK